jgi:hypothetical protein
MLTRFLRRAVNKIGHTGAFKFAEAMESNHTLQSIDLSDNGSLPVETCAAIAAKAQENALAAHGGEQGDATYSPQIDISVVPRKMEFRP